MPKVFVHGVPETEAIWRALLEALEARGVDDLITLSPPGFGVPSPAGFEPTRLGCLDWLIGELEGLGGGVDLVGHDWGAGHTRGVLAERPELLRSWTTDCPAWCTRTTSGTTWRRPGGRRRRASRCSPPCSGCPPSSGSPPAPRSASGRRGRDGRRRLERRDGPLHPRALPLGPAARDGRARRATAHHRPPARPRAHPERGSLRRPARARRGRGAGLGAHTVTLAGQGHWRTFAAAKEVADHLVAHWEAA